MCKKYIYIHTFIAVCCLLLCLSVLGCFLVGVLGSPMICYALSQHKISNFNSSFYDRTGSDAVRPESTFEHRLFSFDASGGYSCIQYSEIYTLASSERRETRNQQLADELFRWAFRTKEDSHRATYPSFGTKR